jgi:hypothetical protein
MKAAGTVAALAAALACTAVGAEEASGRRAAPPDKPSWEFALTAYPTDVRGGDNYTSGIGVADRGPLHLEARYNYESVGARSAFVGWTFSGGDTIKWELTPLLGGAWGTVHAFVPAVEASVSWREFDFYIEAESVRDNHEHSDSYLLRLERARLSAGRVAPLRPRRPAHARLRRRARHPARAVRAGDVESRHPRRLLVQPGLEGPGVRRFARRGVLKR